jgi:2-keto-4-pentenoate hydratase/2-oxohepta-3-ene-1,7-dioic acid hydratase in catechol pathway
LAFHGDRSETSFDFKDIKLLPPVIPSKIVCAGLNYYDHAEELKMSVSNEPVIFLKPSSALIGADDPIVYPKNSSRVDYEGELAVVIKKKARNVSRALVSEYILGYTCFNDITARDLQKIDGQWTRAKSFDTFAPIGPWVDTELDPADLSLRTYLNGELKQISRTSNLIFAVGDLVEFISGIMTLFPGDVIATGTPGGIGPMVPGDEVVVEIEGLGKLTNHVVKSI